MNDIAELLNSATTDLTWQRDFYRDLHTHPELSMQEERTASRIQAKLADFDCEVVSGIGGHGIIAIFRNGEGPTAVMRADFDALPVEETTGVEFASVAEGVTPQGVRTKLMHACGHDMHTTALLGCCALLDDLRDQWSGTFIALFQPSEENGAGALAMVNDGLKHLMPVPDVVLGQHIGPGAAGTVMSKPGPALTAADTIRIQIFGRSSHGSMPHLSVDPTFVAAMIVVRLQAIVGREIPPSEFAVITVGTLTSGNSNNTIPATANLVLNCRTYNDAVKHHLYAAVERVVRAECQASGCPQEPTFEYTDHAPLTDNSPEVFAAVRSNFDAVFGVDSIDGTPWTASEDFSQVPRAFGAPYLYWMVGATPRAQWDAAVAAGRVTEDIPSNHMSNFLPDFEPTVQASNLAAATAVLTYLKK
ncbi:N-acyl-L-amino acid amidohydrolase [Corynebacterium kalinowskii]|uniref:N-acyl-L-amino acid amidohydrolase n=1 Tax=Corynebacterium kalinowskii TaxID=2675216 RepID=A0A6B8VTQ9_9CORY|nr:amidohydrolase [Corynebacterium kalinowskii]QGU02325.1 N-acyl-L-amino acid amidohydrolase [Corynebacterium kalinowskii]